MVTDLSDLHAKQPLPLVEENSLTLAVLQVLHHSPHLVGCLCRLTEVCPPGESSHNHLMKQKTVISL